MAQREQAGRIQLLASPRQAAKMSHGPSSGEVKPEWFEDIFERELRKYHRLGDEMGAHCEQQERALGTHELSCLRVIWSCIIILFAIERP